MRLPIDFSTLERFITVNEVLETYRWCDSDTSLKMIESQNELFESVESDGQIQFARFVLVLMVHSYSYRQMLPNMKKYTLKSLHLFNYMLYCNYVRAAIFLITFFYFRSNVWFSSPCGALLAPQPAFIWTSPTVGEFKTPVVRYLLWVQWMWFVPLVEIMSVVQMLSTLKQGGREAWGQIHRQRGNRALFVGLY